MAAQRGAAHEKTLDLPVLVRAATFVPRSLNEESRTAEVVWTTGARVMRGCFERYYEELSLDLKEVRLNRLNNGAPLLNSHDDSDIGSVIGVVENARIENGKGIATVRFAKAEDDPVAEQIFRKVLDGILQNISVGYQTYKLEEVGKAKDGLPIFRATDWEPYELSVVPMGADDSAGFRSKDTNRTPCVFVTRTVSPPKEKTMSDEETPVTPAPQESPAVAATRAASAARIEDARSRAEAEQVAAERARAEERVRVSEIRKLAKRWKMGDAWASNLIDMGTSVEDARAALLEAGAQEDDGFNPSQAHSVSAGEDARDKLIRGASAWLFQRTGTRQMIETAKRKLPDAFKGVEFDPGEFRGLTPMDLARDCLERSGVRTRGMDRMKIAGMAFTHRSSGYQVASDFATLLENVLGKVLLASHALAPNTWERIAKADEVPDFRTSNRYRTGSVEGLDVIAEHAEYKTGNIPDGAKYPISTQRMGKMFGLTREAIVNDDLSALTDMASKLGQASQRTIENAVYALINANAGLGPTQGDGQPFFHANRANVNATGSALGVGGLDADRTVMGQQKDQNGFDFLDLEPDVLLVPLALKGLALQINDAQFDPSVTNKFQLPNMVRGLFREVVASPRLTGLRRYLIADPRDWIVVAFLEGYGRGPALESQDGWRIDGVEWKVTLYAKAQMGDPRSALTNAGQ